MRSIDPDSGITWGATVCKCKCGKAFWAGYDFCNSCGEPIDLKSIYFQEGNAYKVVTEEKM